MEVVKVTNSCLVEYNGHFSGHHLISPLWSIPYYWLLFQSLLGFYDFFLIISLSLAPALSLFPTFPFLPCFSGFSLLIFYLSNPIMLMTSALSMVTLSKPTSSVHCLSSRSIHVTTCRFVFWVFHSYLSFFSFLFLSFLFSSFFSKLNSFFYLFLLHFLSQWRECRLFRPIT